MADEPLDRTHPIDLHVGRRIRLRRRMMGMSQEKLASELGLTFQQIQKYERGLSRVSASKLYEIARSLKIETAYFFDGISDQQAFDGADRPVFDAIDPALLLSTSEGHELALLFTKIKDVRVRRCLLDLVRLSSGEGPNPTT